MRAFDELALRVFEANSAYRKYNTMSFKRYAATSTCVFQRIKRKRSRWLGHVVCLDETSPNLTVRLVEAVKEEDIHSLRRIKWKTIYLNLMSSVDGV